jgi:hypothetical protein
MRNACKILVGIKKWRNHLGELKRGLRSGINMNHSQIGVKLWVEFNWLCIRHMRKYICEISKFWGRYCLHLHVASNDGKGNTLLVGSCVSEICMSIIFAANLQIAVSPTCVCTYYMHLDKFCLLACGFWNLVSQIKERKYTEDVRA